MGRYLGLGIPFSQAKAQYMADVTVEGAQLAQAIGPTVEQMVAEGRIDARQRAADADDDRHRLPRRAGRVPVGRFFAGALQCTEAYSS